MSFLSYTAYEVEIRHKQELMLAEAERMRLARLARAGRVSLPVVATLHVAGTLHAIADWLESTAPSASRPHPQ
jgi:hypothetical protein